MENELCMSFCCLMTEGMLSALSFFRGARFAWTGACYLAHKPLAQHLRHLLPIFSDLAHLRRGGISVSVLRTGQSPSSSTLRIWFPSPCLHLSFPVWPRLWLFTHRHQQKRQLPSFDQSQLTVCTVSILVSKYNMVGTAQDLSRHLPDSAVRWDEEESKLTYFVSFVFSFSFFFFYNFFFAFLGHK